jgi:GDP-L-fucose synthase
MASASIHVMVLPAEEYRRHTQVMESHVNVGTGEDLTIAELAALVSDVVGYKGRIQTDPSKPDGAPRKLLDVSKIRQLGWQATTSLRAGIELAYLDFERSLEEAVV